MRMHFSVSGSKAWSLSLEAFTESAAEFQRSGIEQAFRNLAKSDHNNFVMGAFVGGELAALAGFYRHKHAKTAHNGTIWGVYVSKEHRKKGLGRALLAEILHQAESSPGIEQIFLRVGSTNSAASACTSRWDSRPVGLSRERLKWAIGT